MTEECGLNDIIRPGLHVIEVEFGEVQLHAAR